MYKNIRRKQKAIDKLQDDLQNAEENKETLAKSDRMFNTNFHNENNTITLSKFVDKDSKIINPQHSKEIIHNVNFETLMQSYIKCQPSEFIDNTSEIIANSIMEMPLPELLERFLKKDNNKEIYLTTNNIKKSIPKTVKPKAKTPVKLLNKEDLSKNIKVSRGIKENNIEVFVGGKKIVLEDSPLWEQIKEGVIKYKRSKSSERTRPNSEIPKIRSSSNPRGCKSTKHREVIISPRIEEVKVFSVPASKAMKIESDADLFKANMQILEVINRHQGLGGGLMKSNTNLYSGQASTTRKNKKQRLQQGEGGELIKSGSRQNSSHATPTPTKTTLTKNGNMLIEKVKIKSGSAKIVTNMIHEGSNIPKAGSAKIKLVSSKSKPMLKIDTVQPRDAMGNIRISNFMSPPLSSQRSVRNPSLGERRTVAVSTRSVSSARGTKRVFSGSVALLQQLGSSVVQVTSCAYSPQRIYF